MVVWVLTIGALSATLLVLLGRHNAGRIAGEWDMMLGSNVLHSVDALERRCQLDHMMADGAWSAAQAALAAATSSEVVRLVDLSYSVLEASTNDRITRLRAVRVCSRMAAALVPLPPLVPRDFRRRELRTLAALSSVAHHLLVSMRERFVMRARVIAFGLVLSLRAMRRKPPSETLEEVLTRFDAAKADWKTLDLAHVEMVRALLVSVAAVRREPAAARS